MNETLSARLKNTWPLARTEKGAFFALVADANTPVLVLSRMEADVAPNKVLALLRNENLSVVASLLYVGRTELRDDKIVLVADPKKSKGAINLQRITQSLRKVAAASGVQSVKQALGAMEGEELDERQLPLGAEEVFDASARLATDVANVGVDIGDGGLLSKKQAKAIKKSSARELRTRLAPTVADAPPIGKEEQALVLARLEKLAAGLSTKADERKVARLHEATASLVAHLLAHDEPDLDVQGRTSALLERLKLSLKATQGRAEIDLSNLDIGEQIASGGTAYLKRVTSADGVPLVGKEPKEHGLQSEIDSEIAAFELLAKKGLADHPSFVKYYGAYQTVDAVDEPITGIVIEDVPGGDAGQIWQRLDERRRHGLVSEPEYWGTVQHVTKGLLEGLEALHRAGLAHMDIKPGNVMLDASGNVKLIDLGSVLHDGKRGNAAVTEEFTAPEASGARGSQGTDGFAVGASLFQMFGGQTFEGRREDYGGVGVGDALREWAATGEAAIVENDDPSGQHAAREGHVGKGGLTAYVDLVNKLMHADPEQRISMADALKHPFVTDPILGREEVSELISAPREKEPETGATSAIETALAWRAEVDQMLTDDPDTESLEWQTSGRAARRALEKARGELQMRITSFRARGAGGTDLEPLEAGVVAVNETIAAIDERLDALALADAQAHVKDRDGAQMEEDLLASLAGDPGEDPPDALSLQEIEGRMEDCQDTVERISDRLHVDQDGAVRLEECLDALNTARRAKRRPTLQERHRFVTRWGTLAPRRKRVHTQARMLAALAERLAPAIAPEEMQDPTRIRAVQAFRAQIRRYAVATAELEVKLLSLHTRGAPIAEALKI